MDRTRKLITLTTVTAVLLLGACGSDDEGDPSAAGTATVSDAVAATSDDSAAPATGVAVDDPWIRESPMVTGAAAGYATLTSAGDDALVAVEVSPEVAARVEVHETVMADGEMGATHGSDGAAPMQMRPVESVELPAGEPVVLEPGGLHLMLLEVATALEEGTDVEMTLVFAEAGEVPVTFAVRRS